MFKSDFEIVRSLKECRTNIDIMKKRLRVLKLNITFLLNYLIIYMCWHDFEMRIHGF